MQDFVQAHYVLFGLPLGVPLNQPEQVTLKTSTKRYGCFSKQGPTLFEWLLCCFGPYFDKHRYRSVWSWSPFLVGCRGTPNGKPKPFWSLQEKRTEQNTLLGKSKEPTHFYGGPILGNTHGLKSTSPWRKRWAVIRWRWLPPGARRGPPVCARGMPTCRCIMFFKSINTVCIDIFYNYLYFFVYLMYEVLYWASLCFVPMLPISRNILANFRNTALPAREVLDWLPSVFGISKLLVA